MVLIIFLFNIVEKDHLYFQNVFRYKINKILIKVRIYENGACLF